MYRIRNMLLALSLLVAVPLPAGATTILANDGAYFSASGNNAYWKFDFNEGYCGKYAAWCQPKHFRWTYTTSGFGGSNQARWTNPYPTDYPSRVYAFIPRRNATSGLAPYTIIYQSLSRQSATVNQMAYYDAWAPLGWGGSYRMVNAVDLKDNTSETPAGRIAFDEIKIEN